MEEALLEAYRRTGFVANTPKGRLRLRVGRRCGELDDLLAGHGVTTWTYVTAFNPRSMPLPAEENWARQRELERSVAELGLVSYPGEGIADDGRWPPEPSLLVLGIGRNDAVRLGQQFGQLAVVYGELGQEAELVVCGQQPDD
ncbi:MAG: DUF3293 domain-containing protein [Candidatus Rokuibacteriota bacterium]